MDDYKHFVSSFINIKDERIKEVVETKINQGKFWPEPLIQFNPSFEQGESAQYLCDKGILHPDLSKIFKNYDLFKHQVEAIKKGCKGLDFVVTSGYMMLELILTRSKEDIIRNSILMPS